MYLERNAQWQLLLELASFRLIARGIYRLHWGNDDGENPCGRSGLYRRIPGKCRTLLDKRSSDCFSYVD